MGVVSGPVLVTLAGREATLDELLDRLIAVDERLIEYLEAKGRSVDIVRVRTLVDRIEALADRLAPRG